MNWAHTNEYLHSTSAFSCTTLFTVLHCSRLRNLDEKNDGALSFTKLSTSRHVREVSTYLRKLSDHSQSCRLLYPFFTTFAFEYGCAKYYFPNRLIICHTEHRHLSRGRQGLQKRRIAGPRHLFIRFHMNVVKIICRISNLPENCARLGYYEASSSSSSSSSSSRVVVVVVVVAVE